MAAGVTLAPATGGRCADPARRAGCGRRRESDTAPLRAAILADLPALLADFHAMRAAEGAALAGVIGGADRPDRRPDGRRRSARPPPARDNAGRDPARRRWPACWPRPTRWTRPALAQELALLAVKTDVTEELDRLAAHVDAARALLADPAPGGPQARFPDAGIHARGEHAVLQGAVAGADPHRA